MATMPRAHPERLADLRDDQRSEPGANEPDHRHHADRRGARLRRARRRASRRRCSRRTGPLQRWSRRARAPIPRAVRTPSKGSSSTPARPSPIASVRNRPIGVRLASVSAEQSAERHREEPGDVDRRCSDPGGIGEVHAEFLVDVERSPKGHPRRCSGREREDQAEHHRRPDPKHDTDRLGRLVFRQAWCA